MGVGTRTSGESGQLSLGALPEPSRAACAIRAHQIPSLFPFYWVRYGCQTGNQALGAARRYVGDVSQWCDLGNGRF